MTPDDAASGAKSSLFRLAIKEEIFLVKIKKIISSQSGTSFASSGRKKITNLLGILTRSSSYSLLAVASRKT